MVQNLNYLNYLFRIKNLNPAQRFYLLLNIIGYAQKYYYDTEGTYKKILAKARKEIYTSYSLKQYYLGTAYSVYQRLKKKGKLEHTFQETKTCIRHGAYRYLFQTYNGFFCLIFPISKSTRRTKVYTNSAYIFLPSFFYENFDYKIFTEAGNPRKHPLIMAKENYQKELCPKLDKLRGILVYDDLSHKIHQYIQQKGIFSSNKINGSV